MAYMMHCRYFAARTLSLLAVVLLLLATVPEYGNAQDSTTALAKNDVLELLRNGVSSKRISVIARQRGIGFQMDAAAEAELRHAGAANDLISALKSLAPAPTATVLVIQSNPGGCRVYVDDEPVGTTSGEGRLKLTKLTPGQHRIRVSLDGYQDFSRNLDLPEGEETDVDAALQAKNAAPENQSNNANNNPYNTYNNGNNSSYDNSANNTTNQATPPAGEAVIYFFRLNNLSGSLISPQIFCDGDSLGKLPNGRYFSMTLPAGHHVFASTSKKTKVELDLASGTSYYLMLTMVNGFPMKGALSLMPNENSAAALRSLYPCGTSMGPGGNQISGCGQ